MTMDQILEVHALGWADRMKSMNLHFMLGLETHKKLAHEPMLHAFNWIVAAPTICSNRLNFIISQHVAHCQNRC